MSSASALYVHSEITDQQPNPKLLADTYASRLGIEVYVPDYIPNPAPDSLLSPAIEFYPGQHVNQSWFSWIVAKLNMLRLIPYLPGIFGCIPLMDRVSCFSFS